ncbi:MAG: hypothetical protein ABI321_08715 [Polyangia bacterium]
MPLDLEAKQDDPMLLAEQLEQEQASTQSGGWLLDTQGSAFLRKFTMALDLAKESGSDITREQYDALRADYTALGATERYAVMSSLSGTFPEFSWFDRDEYDAFCSPP